MFDAIAPEYLHVVTNHIPILGMLAAAVPLLIGVIWKSRAALAAGLVLVMGQPPRTPPGVLGNARPPRPSSTESRS